MVLSDISNCYNVGAVSGGHQTGGIGGSVSGSSITSCYNIGIISGSAVHNSSGQIVGASMHIPLTLSNCFCLIGLGNGVGQNTTILTGMVVEKYEADMKDSAFVSSLGNSKWKMDSSKNNGFPILSWE